MLKHMSILAFFLVGIVVGQYPNFSEFRTSSDKTEIVVSTEKVNNSQKTEEINLNEEESLYVEVSIEYYVKIDVETINGSIPISDVDIGKIKLSENLLSQYNETKNENIQSDLNEQAVIQSNLDYTASSTTVDQVIQHNSVNLDNCESLANIGMVLPGK